MLYLNPPFYFIDGVSLMPDHADPLQWYYMPLAPHLTLVRDASTGKDVPSIQLLLLRPPVPHDESPDAADLPDGGFLSFDVNLGLSQQQLNSLSTKLQALAQLAEPARLAPVPVVNGSVQLLLLGKQSEVPPPPGGHPPGPPPPDGSERFVVKMIHAAKPSLYGDEQAAFSVEITRDGAVAMSQALLGAITPIGVVYSLEYVALRPAYTVKLRVNWDRVQEQLDERFGYSSVFLSVEIDDMVDKLIEQRDIEVEATLFVPEGPEAGSTITAFEKAKAEVREMITSAFFTPSIEPAHTPPDGWDRAAGFADRISQLAVTGGLSSLGAFSYKNTHYTRIDKKALDVTMEERSAVLRSIWPQSHISGITLLVRESGLPMDRFIIWIDLDSDFYKKRTVKVNPIGFTADAGILSVTVHLTYGADTHSVSFAPNATESQTVEWASVLNDQGKIVKDLEYHYTVNFADIPGLARPRTVDTPKKSTVDDSISIFPPDDVPYWVVPVPITTTGNIPWDRWAAAEVDLLYEDPAKGVRGEHHEVMQEDTTAKSWTLFRLAPDERTFKARVLYRGLPDRQDHLVDWFDVDEEQLSLGNPYGKTRKVQVMPSVDWNTIDFVFVDMSYEDHVNALSFQQSLTFNRKPDGTEPDPQWFATDLVDPTNRRVDFGVTFQFKDGHHRDVPKSSTLAERLIVTAEMNGNRIVEVKAGPGDFAAHDLVSITVSLHYANAALGVDKSDNVVLADVERIGTFEFPFASDNDQSFTYGLKYRYGSGLTQSIGPVTTSDDVVVPVK